MNYSFKIVFTRTEIELHVFLLKSSLNSGVWFITWNICCSYLICTYTVWFYYPWLGFKDYLVDLRHGGRWHRLKPGAHEQIGRAAAPRDAFLRLICSCAGDLGAGGRLSNGFDIISIAYIPDSRIAITVAMIAITKWQW